MSSDPPPVYVPPPSSGRSLDFEDAFAYLFRRPGGWKVLMVGGIMLLFFWLVIPLLIVVGYFIALGRTVAEGRPDLPRFQFGLALDGLRALIVMLVYSLPMVALYMIAIVPMFLAEEGEEPGLWVFGSLGLFLLLFAYGLALAAIQPAIYAVFIADGSIGACLSPSRLKEVIRHWRGTYVAAAAVVFGVSQLVGFGFILFLIGIVFTSFYFGAFAAHISGQLARPLLVAPENRFPAQPEAQPPLPA